MDATAFWRMEEQFWKAEASFYSANLSDDALMAFPEPASVLDKTATLAPIANAPRWSSVVFEQQRLIRPKPSTVVLSYGVQADQAASSPAIVRSRRRSPYRSAAGGSWLFTSKHHCAPEPAVVGEGGHRVATAQPASASWPERI
jgi:hypothetical protein